MIDHHWAGTSGGVERMADPDADVSANYVILSDGRILGHVPEEYRAWTSGSPSADNPSITVEVQNSGGRHPGANDDDPRSWPISGKAYEALVALTADIAKRYKWGSVDRSRVRGHREFAPTACPGGFLWNRLDTIAARAHQKLTGTENQEDNVIHYHRENRAARSIKPNETLFLVDSKGTKMNCVGEVGMYSLTAHLYAEGFDPGDALELVYEWYNVKSKKASAHYVHRVNADRQGLIRENVEFKRGAASGDAVRLLVRASKANTSTGKVTLLDSDAFSFGVKKA